MTGPLLPERLEELMAGYVLGNLTPEEAEEFRQLLTEHPELAEEVHRLQEVLEVLPYALPEVAPPLHLRSAILESASVDSIPTPSLEASGNPKPVPWRRLKGSPLVWSRVMAGAAALLALAFGLDNYRLRQEVTTTQAQVARQKDVIAMLQQPNTYLVSLKGKDKTAAASGSLVMRPGEPQAVLILRNLPVLPKGQLYQLWSVVNDEKIPLEQFNTSNHGTAFVKLSIPSKSTGNPLVVTVEASGIARSPGGPMVMSSNF